MRWKVKVMKLLCHGLQCIIVCVWSQSSSSTITTSRCRNCTWQSKGWHSSYFIYNLLISTQNLMERYGRFCPTNSSLFHVLKCLLWKAPSWSSPRQTLFHKMLRVEVLYQLLLLTEAPHTVAALKELSLRPRWLSFICFLWRSADNCQGWINCEYCCIQIRDPFFALKFNICALLKPYTPEFQGCRVKLSYFINFNS